MENKIHQIGSPVNHLSKDLHIIDVTNKHLGNIKFEEIEELLKSIPKIHHSVIENAVQNRSYELLGVTIVMAISQLAQANIKKALYP